LDRCVTLQKGKLYAIVSETAPLNAGEITGILLGSVIFVVVVAVGIWYICRCCRQRKQRSTLLVAEDEKSLNSEH